MPDLIDAYLDRLRLKNFSANTLRAYRQDLRQAERTIGRPLLEASAEDLGRYLDGLGESGMKGTTVRRKQASLRGFFDHAIRAKVLLVDPTGNFEAPKVSQRLPVFLKDSQIRQLLEALDDAGNREQRREAVIVKLFYYTGMRAGELVGLNLGDLFLEDRELRVVGKGDKERSIPIPAALEATIRAWLEVRPGPRTRGPLVTSLRQPFGRLEYRGVADAVKAALERAGLGGRRFTCHKLRHTFATRLINRKVPIDKIQKLLGHRKIDTTTIYAHTALGDELRDTLDGAL